VNIEASVDLSKATKLKEVVLRPGGLYPAWVDMTFKSITAEHRDLQQISIHIPFPTVIVEGPADAREFLGEELYGEWMDLDRTLTQLWESRAVCTKLLYKAEDEKSCEIIRGLLPETMKRG
jgi:hypothetical protein